MIECMDGGGVLGRGGERVEGCGGFFFFQAEDGIRDYKVTGVQTCALPIYRSARRELQGNPAKVRARARRILRDDLGQCAEWIRPALVLAVRWDRQRLAQSSPSWPTEYVAWNRNRIPPGEFPMKNSRKRNPGREFRER